MGWLRPGSPAATWPRRGDWVDCESCSRYSTNGISMAIAFAHNDAAGGCYPNFPEVITPGENHDWGTTDLFPTFGMPSCPRRNPHTDRSRAVTTGDLPPMAPPGTKRSLDRNVQLRPLRAENRIVKGRHVRDVDAQPDFAAAQRSNSDL
jgi:hypothetical protein